MALTIAALAQNLWRSKYAVVITEVVLMTILTLSSFSILVRLTDIKTIGLWVLLNSLLSFSRMADFWSTGLVTFVAEDVGRGNRVGAARLVSTAMFTGAAGFFSLVIVVGPLLYFFADRIPGVEDVAQVQRMLPLMCVTFWLTSVAITYHVGFLGFDRPIFKLIQNVGGNLIFLVLSLLLVPRYGVWGILTAQCIQGFLALGFGIAVFHGRVAGNATRFIWNLDDFKRLAKFGSKATLVGFLQIASDPLIRLLMSKFGGLGAVTLMELATRMIVAVRGLIMSVGQLLVPNFARVSVEEVAATQRLYADARKIFMLVTVPILSCLLAIGPLLEYLMLGQHTKLFLPMLWLLSVGWGVNIIAAPAFFLLTGRRRLRPLFWNRLLMLLAVLVLGYSGGYLFGIIGVTSGVTIGLVIASWVVFSAAREFEPAEGLRADLGLGLKLFLPLVMAGISTAVGLSLASYGQIWVALASVLGCLLTGLSAFWALPLFSQLKHHYGGAAL
jgi:O-antigen/teichoic acid export membrane protein